MPPAEQKARKIKALQIAWQEIIHRPLPEIAWVDVAAGGLRDRADLMFEQTVNGSRLGLFDRFKTGLVDLQGCPQMSESLEAWFQDFRKFQFPIKRGSVRLRVSPQGLRGVWLDFANVDVKALLDERTTLDRLRAHAIVEIGQRRKRLVEREGQLKLQDPILEPWFETYSNTRTISLYSTIGTFTQPGFRANRALVDEVLARLPRGTNWRAAEFGSGVGNFTLPLADVCQSVDVFEIDQLALQGLQRSLAEQNLEQKVRIHSGDFQRSALNELQLNGFDLLLVDPPRSGLMKFLDPIERLQPAERPVQLLYISCFADSFAADAARILNLGYDVGPVSIVDQFPQSRHFEIVASFMKNN